MTKSYIDTHCHLDLFKDIEVDPFSEDVDTIKTLSVTNAPYLYQHNIGLFKDAKNIRIGIGLHPELVQQFHEQINIFEKALETTRYVGEIGLDGSSRYAATFELQKKVFNQLLVYISKADNKILTIHSRNAAAETIEILERHLKNTQCKIILHWYTGDLKSLKKAIDLGCYFSINHQMIATKKGQEITLAIPTSRLLTETDAPFTFDGKIKNRLQSLSAVVDGIAQLLNLSNSDARQLIFSNFHILLS